MRVPDLCKAALMAAAIGVGSVCTAAAVEPGEMLKNPVLEARARTLSEGLRCLVCQNESIDESHAELARDIRLLVRQRLEAGDSNRQIRDFLVARYGDFILLKPPFNLQTLLLWGTPILALLLGGGAVYLAGRRGGADESRPLDMDEQRRLHDLLMKDGRGAVGEP